MRCTGCVAPAVAGGGADLAGGTTTTTAALYRLTGGNPFFVSEAVAAPGQEVPRTVVDAVLARMHQLDTPTRTALEALAVVPSGVELPLARCLLDDLTVIAAAERWGCSKCAPMPWRSGTSWLGERSRAHCRGRCACSSTPGCWPRCCRWNGPTSSRVVHHAVEAGDDEAVVAHGPNAAREATRAGAHRQAVDVYEQVLARRRLLPAAQCATLLDAYAWSLHNMHSTRQAVEAATEAVRLWEELGDDGNVATALVTLARQQWVTDQPVAARESAERALRLVEAEGDTERHAVARLNLGAVLVLTDREDEGLPVLAAALEVADRAGALEPAALCHNYIGSGRLQLGDLSGAADLLRSVQLARNVDHHEYVMRGYRNLIEGLWRLGRYDEAIAYMDEADAYGRDLDFPGIAYCFEARRCRLLAMQGSWPEAETRLRALLAGRPDPGTLARETVPILARLLVRRGDPEAGEVLALARRHAERGDNLEWLATTGIAHIEHAWLSGRPEDAEPWATLLLGRTERPGTALQRGELLRYLQRLGQKPSRSQGARSRTRQECGATGGLPPTPGNASAIRTSGRWRWPSPGRSSPRRGVARARPPRGPAGRGDGAPPAARAGDDPAAPRPAPGYPHQSRRPDRTPGRDPPPARRGAVQRRHRRPTRHLGAHRRPSRGGRSAEARGSHPARGRPRRRRARPDGRALIGVPAPAVQSLAPKPHGTGTASAPTEPVRPPIKAGSPVEDRQVAEAADARWPDRALLAALTPLLLKLALPPGRRPAAGRRLRAPSPTS